MSGFHTYFKKALISSIALAGLLTIAAPKTKAEAQYWMNMVSESAVFTVKMPSGYEEETKEFRLSPTVTAISSEATATIDQNPYVNAEKRYIIKVEQSLGGLMTPSMRGHILSSEQERYILYYESLGGEILGIENDMYQFQFPAIEIQVMTNDPKFGKQYTQIRLITTDVSLIHQIAVGPENSTNSYITRDFFSSLKPLEGYKRTEGKFEEEWEEHVSPLNIFRTYLPSETSVFMPDLPKTDSTSHTERILTRFYDPVWEQSAFYNIYGYKTDRALTYFDAEQLLNTRHIHRHRKNQTDIDCRRLKNSGLPVIECSYSMIPPDGFPYLNRARLRAVFFKNYMMVSELLASKPIIQTPFLNDTIMRGEFLRGPAEGVKPK